MRRAEAIWTRILGVLLILIGLTLVASPEISYITSEKIPHTRYSVKREKILTVPRTAAVLIIGAGMTVVTIVIGKSTPSSEGKWKEGHPASPPRRFRAIAGVGRAAQDSGRRKPTRCGVTSGDRDMLKRHRRPKHEIWLFANRINVRGEAASSEKCR